MSDLRWRTTFLHGKEYIKRTWNLLFSNTSLLQALLLILTHMQGFAIISVKVHTVLAGLLFQSLQVSLSCWPLHSVQCHSKLGDGAFNPTTQIILKMLKQCGDQYQSLGVPFVTASLKDATEGGNYENKKLTSFTFHSTIGSNFSSYWISPF